jgi:peptide-methionine (S)-S-oxide reductase
LAQLCDAGYQYRSAIFYHDEEQRRLALKSKEQLKKTRAFKEPIITEIVHAAEFYPAEDYHQRYYMKNPICYKFHRTTCGRDQWLKELWGDAAGH